MTEKKAWAINGYLALILILALLIGGIALVAQLNFVGIPLIILAIISATGIFVVQPNKSYALVFFGSYLGTIREPGLWLSVPLAIRKGVSLRVRNFNSKTLKVNDIEGNPVEIAAVVVFRVVDTAKAIFDVEKYEEFVEIQSETALRHVATRYAYDNYESEGFSLRGNPEEVSNELTNELQQRLSLAGVEVSEARLTHLAYATEIAGAMLQRQQASAILSARQIIVEGAVGMVQMAIERIENDGVVKLDEERKAAMINNLLVSIVSERATQPVINAGTMY
ncbi:SPFH domain-containing protein [Desulfosporosinus youngiae]|uniref:Membrane protease subunit, stomatin/prohibitin n=1 Tax=Desulfosporosinus youngiae DSM 17734 TaxID=768710 RepID=H5Y369_9FIRM|nr:SPFH domain-containing protein [Desulfosporosinus youngiae]EHQ88764.1 membrane protease subunit, stomatin/prohibitin [Desulfosporosinus youngiae DSM 17734]